MITYGKASHDGCSVERISLNESFDNPTFNPLDKVVELYERLIKEKEVMIEELKRMVSK